MLIRRTSRWILGTAMAAAVAQVTGFAQTIADAFEPDLEAWETMPLPHATAKRAG